MASVRVVQLSAEHLPSLVKRLAGYGAFSLQTRAVLRLLQTRLNPAPFQVFAAGAEGTDLATVTAMWPTADFTVLDVCGHQDSVGRRQLAGLLRAPALAHIWRRPLRVEGLAEGLVPLVCAVAGEHGLRPVVGDGDIQRLFARPEGLPPPPRPERPGVAVRPLQPRHLATVLSRWPYSDQDHYPDTEVMLRDGQRAGLAVGVFPTEPGSEGCPPEQPGAWAVVNNYGAQAFYHTEAAFRGRGLSAMVMVELTNKCIQQNAPVFLYTTDRNLAMIRNSRSFGFVPKHVSQWLCFEQSGR